MPSRYLLYVVRGGSKKSIVEATHCRSDEWYLGLPHGIGKCRILGAAFQAGAVQPLRRLMFKSLSFVQSISLENRRSFNRSIVRNIKKHFCSIQTFLHPHYLVGALNSTSYDGIGKNAYCTKQVIIWESFCRILKFETQVRHIPWKANPLLRCKS